MQPRCGKRGREGTQQFNDAYVELERENFQSVIDGKNTDLYTIKNSRGLFVKITNLGAKIEQIVVPDRDCTYGDVVLGYDSIDGVKNGQGSMGAFIGRYANRIGGATSPRRRSSITSSGSMPTGCSRTTTGCCRPGSCAT